MQTISSLLQRIVKTCNPIKQIEEWCLNNKMTLNENKCYILPIKSQEQPKLSLNNKTLPERSKRSRHYIGDKAELET